MNAAKTVWRNSAPSNIALIKYMGKTDVQDNRPTNSSVSYTLDHLLSFVEITLLSDHGASGGSVAGEANQTDKWESLRPSDFKSFGLASEKSLRAVDLSQKGAERFLRHLALLKTEFRFHGSFLVKSGNGFPSDCGLASSASSFAALTKCAVDALCELTGRAMLTPEQVAELSRKGSGSSCRSLFTPWSVWAPAGARGADMGYKNLVHQVLIVDEAKKAVSSSEAHKRVTTSLLFQGRVERAEQRLVDLTKAMQAQNWREACAITWAEFWDMHVLFETAQPAFYYMSPLSLAALRFVQDEIWEKSGDGPMVTMDAGANIHLLYRPDQRELAERIEKELAAKASLAKIQVIASYHFAGANS